MEHARKLALVDPRQSEHDYLQQRQRNVEYKDVQKLPDIRAKSDLSLDMKRILDDGRYHFGRYKGKTLQTDARQISANH